MSHRIAAVVVVYRPPRELLLRLLGALAGDVERIFLFLNSPIPPDLLADCTVAAQPAQLATLGTEENVGLGRAYNAAAAAACADGCNLLLLFDQDSVPAPGIAARLAAALVKAERQVGPLAAIGPRPEPPVGPGAAPLVAHAAPPVTHAAPSRLAEVAFLISSGSLIPLDAFTKIGPFREDFFIDAIDIEWCFRARARGFHCVMARDEPMTHQVGTGVFTLPLLNLRLSRQPAARLFTFARNQTAMVGLSHVPLWWKARVAALMALRTVMSIVVRRREADTQAILRGVRAGLRGELGPPP